MTTWYRDWFVWTVGAAGCVVCMALPISGFALLAPPSSCPDILVWVLVYPLLEEIVFRGGLQEALLRFSKSISARIIGNIFTSLIFAGAHYAAHQEVGALLVFLPSLVFGAVYERHRKVLPCVLLHSAYNVFYLAAFTLAIDGAETWVM